LFLSKYAEMPNALPVPRLQPCTRAGTEADNASQWV
jgi:hypothetical protein